MLSESERKAVDEFGALVIEVARDDTYTALLEPLFGIQVAATRTLAEKCSQLDFTDAQRVVLHELLGYVINSTISRFLWLLENYSISVVFKSRSGEKFDLRRICEALHRQLYIANGPDDIGWIRRFSKYDERLPIIWPNRQPNGPISK